VDYPFTALHIEVYIQKIVTFLENYEYEKIIVCGLSFGELVARHLIATLPDTFKEKIILHISVCGVSTFQSLSEKKKRILYCNRAIFKSGLAVLAKKVLHRMHNIENK
jgi:pimeloyl-ACP methyl ester carboxylesterase